MNTKKAPRLFIDMDGTLARFHDEAQYLERMYENGFFQNLKPFENAVEGIKLFIKQNPETEVFILSSEINDQCLLEKRAWLREYLPEIDIDHQIMAGIDRSKASYVRDFSQNDVLWDDYNDALEQWSKKGGISVKCKNNINHRGLNGTLWSGSLVDNSKSPVEIANDLYAIVSPELTMKLYSPIFPKFYEKNRYGDIANDSIELSPSETLEYFDEIKELIRDTELPEEKEIGWAAWFGGDDRYEAKIKSIKPDIEIVDDKIFFTLTVKSSEPLSETELCDLKEYCIGQQADGWGEGFEQQDIKTADGVLNVSLWDSSDDYFILTEDEFFNRLESEETIDLRQSL